MPNPLVSIITPCFRQAHYLGAAIDSVLRQSYPLIEMIVVNDGSDDDTDAVAAAYAGKITYLRQTNMGLSSARNTGIAAASGEYLLFLDSDDLLDSAAIQSMIEAIDGRRDCLALIGVRYFDTDPGIGEERFIPDEPLLPRLFSDNSPPHSYLASARLVKAAGGFTKKAPGCEDWELWLRIALRDADVAAVPRIGALYRRYAGSMSTHSLNMDRGCIQVLLGVCEEIQASEKLARQWGHVIPAIEKELASLYFHVGYHLAQNGELSHSIESYRRSMSYGFSTPRAMTAMAKAIPHFGRHRIGRLLTK